ncbi:protein-tyrosine phosphatase-like protein [Scenedesmus sp. NREL 46B-D3]|nr:protein-tyrosine phosphatase-like protein [Scenedesmus sp. NREL 46B-D3]
MSKQLLTRRNLGLAGVGLAATSAIHLSFQQRANALPQAPRAEQMATSASMAPASPLRAVNLRDIGEVDPRLRKGVLYRCSQIYTPDVLHELKIRTVVDLRGRAEKKKTKSSKSSKDSEAAAAPAGPPQLLPYDQAPPMLLLLARGSTATSRAAGQALLAPPRLRPAQHRPQTTSQSRACGTGPPPSISSISSVDSEEESSGNGNGVRRASGTDEMAVGLTDGVEDAMGFGAPERETFNVIPTKEFGLAMLRMPWRVWRSALGNLATGHDARKPFVDAFADEQLLGFTKYYTIILEHAKKNIAGVMRIFAKEKALPALVHCAHGKDRTGVVIMLLLLVCDVPHEAIVQDYVQSEIQLRQYRESLGLPDPTGATGAVIPLNDVIIASTQETLRALLAYMDSTYITVDNYLASCGLTKDEINAIRNNLLKPGAPRESPMRSNDAPSERSQAAAAAAASAVGRGQQDSEL